MAKISFSVVAWICVVSLFSLEHVVGLSPSATPCDKDSGCLIPDSYCLNGYCEQCIPCQFFGRQASLALSTCAKNEDDCGPCIAGLEAADHTEQRHSFRCTIKVGEVGKKSESSWITWIIGAWITASILVGGVSIYIFRAKISVLAFQRPQLLGSSRPTPQNLAEVVQGDPPYNPNWRMEHEEMQALTSNVELYKENHRVHVNNVQAVPFSVNSDAGEDQDGPATSLLSNVSLNFDESMNDDAFDGEHEGEIIELSNFRNEHSNHGDNSNVLEEESRSRTIRLPGLPAPVSILPTSADNVYSIDLTPDNPQNGADDFSGNRDQKNDSFGFFFLPGYCFREANKIPITLLGNGKFSGRQE